MPFGLKNVEETYQHAMVDLFHDMIHQEIEVYVDDMIARSQTEEEYLDHLQKSVWETEEVQSEVESKQMHIWGTVR